MALVTYHLGPYKGTVNPAAPAKSFWDEAVTFIEGFLIPSGGGGSGGGSSGDGSSTADGSGDGSGGDNGATDTGGGTMNA